MALFAVYVEWKLFWCQIRRLFVAAALSLVSLCTTHFVTARLFLIANGHAADYPSTMRVVLLILRQQLDALSRMLPSHLWLPVIGLGIGAAALTLFAAIQTLDNRRSWSQFLLNVALTLGAVLLLCNAPVSPWGVVAPLGALPAVTYLLAGMGLGLLAASWRAWRVMDDPVDTEDLSDSDPDEGEEDAGVVMVNMTGAIANTSFRATRVAGALLAPALVALIACAGLVNGSRQITDDGSFADRAADVLLDQLKGRTWVVANGLLDAHILVRAHARQITVRLLCPYRATERNYTAAILRTVQSDPDVSENAKLRAASLIAYNFHVFVEDLFATDAGIGGKAVSMGLPDIWYGSGWAPVPEKLVYGGIRTLPEIKGRDLLAEHESFWSAWKSFLGKTDARMSRQTSYRHRLALRQHLAFVANNLGVTLADLDRPEEAFRAYQEARAIDPANISALLNVFALISRGLHPELKLPIERELRLKVEDPKQRYSLWALSRTYGYVRNYEMFMQMGWSWALSSSPGAVLAGLRSEYAMSQSDDRRAALTALMAAVHEMHGDREKSAAVYRETIRTDPKNTTAISGLVRLALQESVVDGARKILEDGENAGASKRLLRQDWAAVYLVAGDLPRARVVLQELADEPNANPMSLAMLAMVMIEQKDVASVEAAVLPKLVKAASGNDSYFSQVVQGQIWQHKGKAFYANALVCFQRAALFRPDVQALQDVILMLVVSMEDQRAAEARALTILRQRPDHPFANFIIGSIRLEQGQYGDAETYLRLSTAGATPTLAALNNYAQVLCRLRKLGDAERAARRATEIAPDRYEGWSTLALILATGDKLDDAAAALARSRALNTTDSRLSLVDGVIAVKRGDLAAAEKALADVGSETALSVADNRELQNLTVEVARLRNKR
jgi:tetratricopeptide (TPR) repeat protein